VALCPCCPYSSQEEDSSRSAVPVVGIPVAAVAPPVSLRGAAQAQCAFAAVAPVAGVPEAERLHADCPEEVRSPVCCPEEVPSRAGCQEAPADAALAEERLAACLADALALPAWCAGFPDASARAGRSADFPAAVAPVAPAAAPAEPMADVEPDGCSAHCFPACSDVQPQDCFPELQGAGPFGLVAEEHFPEHQAVALLRAERCCSRGLPVAVLLHPGVERYCPVIPDAGLLRQGEQAEHSPARRDVQHLLVHWPAHALHCFPAARVVQHLPVRYQVPESPLALLAVTAVPASPAPRGQFSPEAPQGVTIQQPAALAGSESRAGGLQPPAGSSLAVEAQLARYEPRPSRFGVAAGCFSPRHA